MLTIRKCLTKLVRNGAKPDSIVEGEELLQLRTVTDDLPDDYDEYSQHDPAADPIVPLTVKMLEEAIQRIPSRPYKQLLRTVLGLADGTADLTLDQRRKLAGDRWKRGVSKETIRSHHEPRALMNLAIMLAVIDAERHGEESPNTSGLLSPQQR